MMSDPSIAPPAVALREVRKLYRHGQNAVTEHAICGLGIFNATLEETTAIMNGDPGVQAGIFTYQLHPVRSFPGSTLPPAPSAPSRTRPTQPDA